MKKTRGICYVLTTMLMIQSGNVYANPIAEAEMEGFVPVLQETGECMKEYQVREEKESENGERTEVEEEEKPGEKPGEEEKPEEEPEKLEKPEEEPEEEERPEEEPEEEERPEEEPEEETEKPKEEPEEEEKPEEEPEEEERPEEEPGEEEKPEEEPEEEEKPEEESEELEKPEKIILRSQNVSTYILREKTQRSIEKQIQVSELKKSPVKFSKKDAKESSGTEMTKKQQEKSRAEIFVKNLVHLSTSNCAVQPAVVLSSIEKEDQVKIVLENAQGCTIPGDYVLEKVENGIQCELPKVNQDGAYTLKISGVDHDGQELKKEIIFHVNQRGTEFSYDREKAEAVVQEVFEPVVYMENIDTTQIISCKVNGKEAKYSIKSDAVHIDKKEVRDGINRITLTVQDAAGNISQMDPWEFKLERNEEKEKKSVQMSIKMIVEIMGEILPKVI